MAAIEAELDQARADLQETLSEVNAKFQHAEQALRPEHLIQRHPIGASCLAGGVGYLIGLYTKKFTLRPALIVGLLAYTFSRVSSEHKRPG